MNSIQIDNTTQLLLKLSDNKPGATDQLMIRVYDELKALAVNAMRHERVDHTLQPTALVNEAFLRLIDQQRVNWQNRAHFCSVAAHMMRRVLISHARNRAAQKRGGGASRVPLHDEMLAASSRRDVDVIELDELLTRLAELNPRHAQIIELRFFTGLTIEESAVALGVSDWTVKNDWRVARAWLLAKLDSVEAKK